MWQYEFGDTYFFLLSIELFDYWLRGVVIQKKNLFFRHFKRRFHPYKSKPQTYSFGCDWLNIYEMKFMKAIVFADIQSIWVFSSVDRDYLYDTIWMNMSVRSPYSV